MAKGSHGPRSSRRLDDTSCGSLRQTSEASPRRQRPSNVGARRKRHGLSRPGRIMVPAAMISGGKMKASVFYRIAAVLLLLFAIGHTLGFRQSDPHWGVDALLASMRSIHFDVQGFNRTLLGPLCGGRILCRRVLSIRGDLGLAARRPSGSNLSADARYCMGVRALLCRHHSCELEIPLHRSHRFLHRDHIVSDGGGMAFREAGLTAPVATLR